MTCPVRGLGIARPDYASWKDAPGDAEGNVALLGLEVVSGGDLSGGYGPGVSQPDTRGRERNGAKTDGSPAIAPHQLAESGERENAGH